MFRYPSQPDTEYEARAAIWAALNEIAYTEAMGNRLDENSGPDDEASDRLRMQLEGRSDDALDALQNYGNGRWIPSHEYSEWWSATVGETGSDIGRYCFDF